MNHIKLFENFEYAMNESINPQHVINTNNKINSSVDKLLTKFKNNNFGQRNKIQAIVKNYVNDLNSKAPLIVKQISSGKGTDTANLYLDTLKQTFYKEFNNLSTITKFTITKYYTEDELRREIQKNMNLIDEIYDNIMITTLMYLHDPSIENEVKWYDTAYDVLVKRRPSLIKHLIDWISSELY